LTIAQRLPNQLAEVLGSMRFAVSLLIVVSLVSSIGTILEQDATYNSYVDEFGPFWTDIFDHLGIFSIYSAWWFSALVLLLIGSLVSCIARNGRTFIREAVSWKVDRREPPPRSLPHRIELTRKASAAEMESAIRAITRRNGFRFVTHKIDDHTTLIAAKKGSLGRVGYLLAHSALILICVGATLSGDALLNLQMRLQHKTLADPNDPSGDRPEHRLSAGNPAFRGFASVREGDSIGTIELNRRDGLLYQKLPFQVELERFAIDFYSTGMPKRFASRIIVIDRETGTRIPAQIEVNKPFTYRGISIFQANFKDGGSSLKLRIWPLQGPSAKARELNVVAGHSYPFDETRPADDGDGARPVALEIADFRAMNVEDAPGSSTRDANGRAPGAASGSVLNRMTGSGATSGAMHGVTNLGPSLEYRVRTADGQSRDFIVYMQPLPMDGARVFLAGVRNDTEEPFRYMRIPADDADSMQTWMRLGADLDDPLMRAIAAHRYAAALPGRLDAQARGEEERNAAALLERFVGAPHGHGVEAGGAGYLALREALNGKAGADRERSAKAMLQTLDSLVWQIWTLHREQAGLPVVHDEHARHFVRLAVDAFSDRQAFGAPCLVQLDSFSQVNASVLQFTRDPGRRIVYTGCLLLVLGIFAMLYLPQRRAWFWIHGGDGQPECTTVFVMSSTRRTVDFEREFLSLHDALAGDCRQAEE
jgi:cytochrome c biogenesis protein